MSNVSFANDPFSRKVTRFLLLLQIAAMILVVGLSIIDRFFLAIAISFLTFVVFILTLLWLYARYREFPLVREKRELQRLVLRFQKTIQTEEKVIQEATKERERLFQAEKNDINTALSTLQKNYIENGLTRASIQEADIPGVGPKLKQQLVGYGILSAAEVTEKISELPGFGEAKCLALMGWRSSVTKKLESTQPGGLPPEQLETIQGKYHALYDQNNAAERKAHISQEILEHELISFRPRLQQLVPFTFVGYLSKSLASHGMVAALLALVLIMTQLVSSVSAMALTASSILASIPTVTTSPAGMIISSEPGTLIIARMSTATPSPAGTLTLSPTNTTTLTATAPPTQTATSTSTPLPTFTFQPTLRPTNTAIIPVSGGGNTGNCEPSYPGVCIPPPPPDLDCGDISYRRFQVLPPDPHNFDRDGDGIGCES